MEQLSSHLAANLAELNARFGQSADFYAKELELYHCKGAIVLFDGMASLKGLWQLLLDAASRRTPPGPAEQLTGEQVFALLLGLPYPGSNREHTPFSSHNRLDRSQ